MRHSASMRHSMEETGYAVYYKTAETVVIVNVSVELFYHIVFLLLLCGCDVWGFEWWKK